MGYASVNKMLDEISVDEFNEWRAFSLMEPFGCGIEDARTARIIQAVYHANTGKWSRLEDNIPDYSQRFEPLPDDDDLEKRFMALVED